MSERAFLPYGRQTIDEDDVAAVAAALRGEYLTTGPVVSQFEEALKKRVGAFGAIACSSATAGLHLATAAIGLGPGDFVIVPTVTFLATANAVRYCGAEVVFADVDAQTGLMTPETLEEAISRCPVPPRAIMPVHLNGWSCDMAQIAEIARRHGARVIEDAAHALGATTRDRNGVAIPVGGCAESDMVVFSFHPVKTVAMGEGGAVTARDPDLLDSLALLRSHGIERNGSRFINKDLGFDADGSVNPWYYEMHQLGWNYRVTDIQCALGLSQLSKLDRFLARRGEIADHYDSALAGLAPIASPVPRSPIGTSGWHLYPVLVDFEQLGASRAAIVRRLRDEYRVGTQVHYVPVHLQPYYWQRYGNTQLPGALEYYRRVLSIPFYPSLTDGQIERVLEALRDVLVVGGVS